MDYLQKPVYKIHICTPTCEKYQELIDSDYTECLDQMSY